ncbi:hypothetical protein D3C72_2105750 [compost metagenome]
MFQTAFYDFIQNSLFLDAMNARPVSDVIIDAHWKWVGTLEHHTDALTKRHDIGVRTINVVTVYGYVPCNPHIINQIIHPVQGT